MSFILLYCLEQIALTCLVFQPLTKLPSIRLLCRVHNLPCIFPHLIIYHLVCFGLRFAPYPAPVMFCPLLFYPLPHSTTKFCSFVCPQAYSAASVMQSRRTDHRTSTESPLSTLNSVLAHIHPFNHFSELALYLLLLGCQTLMRLTNACLGLTVFSLQISSAVV